MADTPKRDSELHTGHRQRMKERLQEKGDTAFSKHELVEMLLYYAIPRKDTNELAHRLLNEYGTLENMFKASYEELLHVKDMTPHAACLFQLMRGVVNELERERIDHHKRLDTLPKIGEHMVRRLAGAQVEQAWLLCLNNRGDILGEGMLSEGSVNSAEINVRQALQLAVRCNATVAVLAHNHPGGHVAPSKSDAHVTEQVAKALKMVGVTLADHIIVADSAYSSMREHPIYRNFLD